MKKKEKTRIVINYGTGLAALPAEAFSYVDKAKKFDLKVLLLIASSEKYREGNCISAIADMLSAEEEEVSASVAFWRGTGILTSAEIEETTVKKTERTEKAEKEKHESTKEQSSRQETPKRARVSDLPQYTSAELNELLARHSQVVGLIDECQNILGKIFTAADIKVIMGLVDYFGLDNDYIILLMHFAAKNEQKSLRYIEKLAVSCLDDGYTDARSLENELRAREARASFEGKIRSIFGIGTRKFNSKEKACISKWSSDFGYGTDIIEKAYDITINATSKPSIPYAHAILERWYTNGVRTLEDAEAAIAQRESERTEEGSSFNIDDFFNAAIERSYADKK